MKDDTVSRAAVMESLTRESMTIGEIAGVLELVQSWGDITDMQQAIIYAEENLLRIGMPFTPDYDFHGRNASNMKRRNDKLRRLYNMDEVEKEAEEWRNRE